MLARSMVTDTFEFDEGMLTLLGITIDQNNQLKDKSLKETAYLNPDHDFVTAAILRNGKTIIPHGSSKFRENDHAYFIAQPGGVKRLLSIGKRQTSDIKDVMIMGGSKIGYHVARRLSKLYNIKLVEKDRDRSYQLADELVDTLVVNGDCSDVELLKEEGIQDMDAFVAVTGNLRPILFLVCSLKTWGLKKPLL